MMRGLVRLACVTLLLGSVCAAQHRDPLTPQEIDQLRDAAQDPVTRLRLYLDFARARLTAVDTMRADPKTTNRAQKTHDGLEDFAALYDELNDNLDSFIDRDYDVRKPLKAIIEADTEFQAKLHGLQGEARAKPEELKEYEFALSTAIDDVNSGSQDHRKALDEQEEAAKKKKLKKPDLSQPTTKSLLRKEPRLPLPDSTTLGNTRVLS